MRSVKRSIWRIPAVDSSVGCHVLRAASSVNLSKASKVLLKARGTGLGARSKNIKSHIMAHSFEL